MARRTLVEGLAATAALAAATGTAVSITHLARGNIRGAPGMSHALARIGKVAGGGMTTGIALAAGSGALVGLSLYRGILALSS